MGKSTNFIVQPAEKKDVKRLFAMDSTTITLFKDILKGCGRLPN
jgi:hypothetical protein